jgi:hypothetical protein
MSMRSRQLLLVAAVAAVLGSSGCENAVPLFPRYTTDIKPIMQGHCIRCHGGGGMLNADPVIAPISNSQKPTQGDFTQLADKGMTFGLMHYTGALAPAFKAFVDNDPMPPPPAPPLTPFEYDTLMTWMSNPLGP